jgi:hypothetical protein
MPSLNAFKKLDKEVRLALCKRLAYRTRTFVTLGKLMHGDSTAFLDMVRGKILLIGDRPAPSAPDDPEFHYTPFAALWHSSLWLNLKLHEADVPEEQLCWINSADFHGQPTRYGVMLGEYSKVICLGGAAEAWLKKADPTRAYEKVHHPSSWKRFNSGKPYPLIELLT